MNTRYECRDFGTNTECIRKALSLWSDWAHEDHCTATAHTPYPDEDELARCEAIMRRCKEVVSRLDSGESALEHDDGVDWRSEDWVYHDTDCVIQALMWAVDTAETEGFRARDGRTSDEIRKEYEVFVGMCMDIAKRLHCGGGAITRKEAT